MYMWWKTFWFWVGEEHKNASLSFWSPRVCSAHAQHTLLAGISLCCLWSPVLVCYPWLMLFLHVVPGHEAGATPWEKGLPEQCV